MSSVKAGEFYTEVYVPLTRQVYEYPALSNKDDEKKKKEALKKEKKMLMLAE